MNNPFDLTGRAAVVTGAGGILGRGFCEILAAHGAAVALVDIDAAAAEAVAEGIRSRLPDAAVHAVRCDVSDPGAVAAMTRAVLDRLGRVDILLNNAAGKTHDLRRFFAPFEDYELATWREVMAVNLDGMFLVAQAIGRQMVAQGTGGSIVQTASVYGVAAPDPRIYEGSDYLGGPINTPAVYSASKAGVIGLTRYLAAYWAPKGIRVNAVTPGGVESGQNDTFRANYSARVPLGRMARASELQAAVLFLASEASSYVTGQNLIVDGGLTCW